MKPLNDRLAIIDQLIDRAKEGKHLDREYIVNIREYISAVLAARSLKSVVNIFTDMSTAMLLTHAKNIARLHSNVDQLICYKELMSCKAFYEYEYKLMVDSINDFKTNYLYKHFFMAILGYNRD